MKITVRIREEKDGYSAEFPALPGCFTEGDTYEELMHNIREVLEGWFMVDDEVENDDPKTEVLEIVV